MSTTDDSLEPVTDAPERGVIRRVYAAEMRAGDGRTVDVRIVPFGERAMANDGLGGVAAGVPYDEEWMPGCFDHQLNAANRVLANFEHQAGIGGVVGHGLSLHAEADGYHGSFRMHETSDGEKALMLIRENVLGGVSLEAVPAKSIRTATGIVQRVKAHLRAVAFCRTPAFDGARVLAVREQQLIDAELLPYDIDVELVERLRAQNIALPDRYAAHPADTDTPSDDGTPDESGTRPDPDTSSQED